MRTQGPPQSNSNSNSKGSDLAGNPHNNVMRPCDGRSFVTGCDPDDDGTRGETMIGRFILNMRQGLYGVLFVMAKDAEESTAAIQALLMAIDFLQVCMHNCSLSLNNIAILLMFINAMGRPFSDTHNSPGIRFEPRLPR